MLTASLSAFDPTRTSASISCCSSEVGFSLYQSTSLNRYDAVSSRTGGHAAQTGSPCIATDWRQRMFRTFLAAVTLAAPAIAVAPLPGLAQSDYPNRLVKIVVPYGPGTIPDIFARALTTGLSGRLGQQFIVENKVGGSGALGTASVARAEADGYAMLFAPALVLSVLPQSRNDTGYRHDSLVPVCQTFVNTMGLAVRPGSPIKSIADLVATAKQNPGALNYGHPGVMTIPHLAMEEFMQAAAIDIRDMTFRGGPQSSDCVLSRECDM